eukprot:TRINITY_DN328_c0_g1_i1.p1 TRINITY_DN328_c0_g1~~TRINITY_DN328_c0_g1_i1.p1  ORF type:complete len:540 (+),score=187.60 TRINITY_DN328_c0_g1_i1:156-1775(+)
MLSLKQTLVVAALVLCAVSAAQADDVKCGDWVSINSKTNGRYWMNRNNWVMAMANQVEPHSTYQVVCKIKPEGETLAYGDTIYLKNEEHGEYLDDGTDGTSHSGVSSTVKSVPKSTTLGARNEFTLFKPGASSALNDRSLIVQDSPVALRNRHTRFLSVLRGSTAITTEQYGDNNIADVSIWYINAFCPRPNEKECNNRGKCVNSRCVCSIDYKGAACTIKRETAFCHTVGGVHFRSFDNLWYNLYSEGEFLLYQTPSNNGNEAVTAKGVRVSPDSEAVSVSAVMVRRNDDIVRFEVGNEVTFNCGENLNLGIIATGTAGFKTNSGLVIKSINKKNLWSIQSPNGLKVTIHILSNSINLYTHIFEAKDGDAKGLCGNFDGKAGNDLGGGGWGQNHAAAKSFVTGATLSEEQSLYKCAKNSEDAVLGQPAVDKGSVTLKIGNVVIDGMTPKEIALANIAQAKKESCKNEAKNINAAETACKSVCADNSDVDVMNGCAVCISDDCNTRDADTSVAAAKDAIQGDKDTEPETFKGTNEALVY